ncbi:hypothetical protein C7S18_01480 [Ahniella affigens]|uniref:Sel1 repeat family protein n=1 Tax=Ahniella affigens TaxID=2021234 RepID=A0A2P1PM78_9GAMM|nr:tetratricopeptide repeat protein [Ahniella affigens]AVP95948.1 hypothetical protein C7S18_01480 [Ahniella affigens]
MITNVWNLRSKLPVCGLMLCGCLMVTGARGEAPDTADSQTRSGSPLEALTAAADQDPTRADFPAIWNATVRRYKVRDVTEVKRLLAEWDEPAEDPNLGSVCKDQLDRLESARQQFFFSLALQKRSLQCAEQNGDEPRASAREALIAALLKHLLQEGAGQSWQQPLALTVYQDADALADLAGLEILSRRYDTRDNGEMRLLLRVRAPGQRETSWYFDPLLLPISIARAQNRTIAEYPGFALHHIARLQAEQLGLRDPAGLVTYAQSMQPKSLDEAREALEVWQTIRSISPADGGVGITELCLSFVGLECIGAAVDGLLDLAPKANSDVLATLAALTHRGAGVKRDKKAARTFLDKAKQAGVLTDVLRQYAHTLAINTLWQISASGDVSLVTSQSGLRRDAMLALEDAALAGDPKSAMIIAMVSTKNQSIGAHSKALQVLERASASGDPELLLLLALGTNRFPGSESDFLTRFKVGMLRALDAGAGAAGTALYGLASAPRLEVRLDHPPMHYLRKGAQLGDPSSIRTLLEQSPAIETDEVINWLYSLLMASDEKALPELLTVLRHAKQADPVVIGDVRLVATALQKAGDAKITEELRWFRLRWSKDAKVRDAALAELLEHHSKQPSFWYDLGRQFEFGSSRLPTDFATAARYYEMGAKAGSADAMTFYAYALRYGRGVDRDLPAALRWLEQAAEAGGMEAINNLAWMRCTIADNTIRDGEAGLKVIQRVKADDREPGHWDTEAACLAALERFDEAVSAQQRAVDSCAEAARQDGSCRYSKRLVQYQHREAVRIAETDNELGTESK